MGVFVPLVGGTLLYGAFYGLGAIGSPEFYKALFIGTIMTATSVSITVATLQELGQLKGFLGTTIVSAAVIDDVIGIVVLTCVLGAGSGEEGGTSIGQVLINTVLFFVVAVIVGFVLYKAMTWLDNRNPHTQRITIASLGFCFAMAYIAEQYFALPILPVLTLLVSCCATFMMHLCGAPCRNQQLYDVCSGVLCFHRPQNRYQRPDSRYPAVLCLLCHCGTYHQDHCCGLAAKICKFNWADSLKVGVGMMTRGEVALIVAQKGLAVGMVDAVYFTAVILLIIVSSVTTPLALKTLFAKHPSKDHPAQWL
mgnify:CR=1 FL=1